MLSANGCTGSRWKAGAAPATVSEEDLSRSPTPSPSAPTPEACGDAGQETTPMKPVSIAGIAGLAACAAHAQAPFPLPVQQAETVVVTATRAFTPDITLRDVVVITRD